MRADTYEQLYRYEDEIENALKLMFEATSIAAIAQRDTDIATTPRIAIQFQAGAASGHVRRLGDGSDRPDVFKGQLTCAVFTDRTKDEASEDSGSPNHTSFRATVRNLIYGFRDTINPRLRFHAFMRVLESGTSPTIITESNQDASEIRFDVDFNILPDAWPV